MAKNKQYVDKDEFNNSIRDYILSGFSESVYDSRIHKQLTILIEMIIFKFTQRSNDDKTQNQYDFDALKQELYLIFFRYVRKFDVNKSNMAFGYFYKAIWTTLTIRRKQRFSVINNYLNFSDLIAEDDDETRQIEELIGATEDKEEPYNPDFNRMEFVEFVKNEKKKITKSNSVVKNRIYDHIIDEFGNKSLNQIAEELDQFGKYDTRDLLNTFIRQCYTKLKFKKTSSTQYKVYLMEVINDYLKNS